MKFKIIDNSLYTETDLLHLDDGWYEDENGDVCYDFEDIHECIDSMAYNLEIDCEYNDVEYDDEKFLFAIQHLADCGWVVINGFTYVVVKE